MENIFPLTWAYLVAQLVKNPPAMQETPVRFLGREGIDYPLQYSWASLVAQLVKNVPAMPETWIRSLGCEGYLPQYSGLENFIDCIIHGVTKSQTGLSNFHFHLNA